MKAKGVMPLLDDADSHLAALFTSFDDEVLKERWVVSNALVGPYRYLVQSD